MALASNIGAAATLIGNPQDMLIGEYAHLDFGAYMLWSLPPVLISLGAGYGIVWWMSRASLKKLPKVAPHKLIHTYPYNRPHTVKGLILLVVAVALFFTPIPKEITALAVAGIHLASRMFKSEDLLDEVDWQVLVLFMCLFALTGAFQSTGYADAATAWLAHAGFDVQKNINLALAAAGLSNVIGNGAAVMLLLKVANFAKPTTAYVLALANSFGGSLLIAGSVSNLIVAQQAQAMGVSLSFKDFARLGIPVALTSLGVLLVWAAWMG
jgi:Na+/H+ antiporter NhaD/arsenite permease-like protein